MYGSKISGWSYCKNEVLGLNKIVDDFDYSILHHLIDNNQLYNKMIEF